MRRDLPKRDLRNANFACVDLRGADFRGADLSGATFAGARMGLAPLAVARLALAAALLGLASGFLASTIGERVRGVLFAPAPAMQVVAAIVTAEIVLYLAATLWKGTSFAIEHVALPTIALIVGAALVLVVSGVAGARPLAVAAVVALFIVLLGLVVGLGVLARTIAAAGTRGLLVVVLAATMIGVRGARGSGLALAVAVVATELSALVGRGQHARASGAARVLERVKTLGGTSFRGADLSHANFAGARLRNVDFRGARLDGVRWEDADEIAFCRFDPDVPAPAPKRMPRRAGAGLARHEPRRVG